MNSMSHRKHARQRSSISEGSNDIPQSPSGHRLSELIFSSRVDPEFQKGYEQFRAEWERRKSSKESRGSVDSETSAKLPVTDSSRSRRHGSASLRGRRISRTADSADSSPAVSRSPSPPGLHSPHSRFTSSTSLSSAPEPTTPPDESDLELADLVDDHIKGRRSSKASSLHRIESDDEFEGR